MFEKLDVTAAQHSRDRTRAFWNNTATVLPDRLGDEPGRRHLHLECRDGDGHPSPCGTGRIHPEVRFHLLKDLLLVPSSRQVRLKRGIDSSGSVTVVVGSQQGLGSLVFLFRIPVHCSKS